MQSKRPAILKKSIIWLMPTLQRTIKITLIITTAFVGLLLLFSLLFYLPPVQRRIIAKAESSLNDRMEGEIKVRAIRISPSLGVGISELSLISPEKDTVWYSEKLKCDVSIRGLLRSDVIIQNLSLKNARAELLIDPEGNSFNIDFLLAAFKNDKNKTANKSTNWSFLFKDVQLEKVRFHLNTGSDGVDLMLDAGRLELKSKVSDVYNLNFVTRNILIEDTKLELDLKSDSASQEAMEQLDAIAQELQVTASSKKIDLKNIRMQLRYEETGMEMAYGITNAKIREAGFQLLDMTVRCNEIDLKDAYFSFLKEPENSPDSIYLTKNPTLLKDFNSFDLRRIRMSANSIFLHQDSLLANIESLGAEESEGLILSDVSGNFKTDRNNLLIEELTVKTKKSSLQTNLTLHNFMGNQFINNPSFAFEKTSILFAVDELQPFFSHPLIDSNAAQTIRLSTSGEYVDDHLLLNRFELISSDRSILYLKLDIDQLHKPGSSNISLTIDTAHIAGSYAYSLLPFPDNISLPEYLSFQGNLERKNNILQANAALYLYDTQANLKLYYAVFSEYQDSFELDLNLPDMNIQSIIPEVHMQIGQSNTKIYGSGFNNDYLAFDASFDFRDIYYNDSLLTNLSIESTYKPEGGNLILASEDSSARMQIVVGWENGDSALSAEADASIDYLDLYKYGFSKEPLGIKTTGKSTTSSKSSSTGIHVLFTDFVLVEAEELFIPYIDLDYQKNQDNLALQVTSKYFSGNILSNVQLTEIPKVLLNHMKWYVDPIKEDQSLLIEPVRFSISANFSDSFSIYRSIPKLEQLNINNIEASFNGSSREFVFNTHIPMLKYNGVTANAVTLNIQADSNNWKYRVDLPYTSYKDISLDNILLAGYLDTNVINNHLTKYNDSIPDYQVGFQVTGSEADAINIRLIDDGTLINSQKWQVLGLNTLSIHEKSKTYGELGISSGRQQFMYKINETGAHILIQDLSIQNFTNILSLSDSTTFSSGIINADLRLGANPALSIKISDWYFQEIALGDFEAELTSVNDNEKKIQAKLRNNEGFINLAGSIFPNDKQNLANLFLSMDISDISDYEKFVAAEVRNIEGQLKANLNMKGNLRTHELTGKIEINNASAKVLRLNSTFSIQNNTVEFQKDKLIFNKFSLYDKNNNKTIVQGYIQRLKNDKLRYDLTLKGDNFTLLDRTEENNSEFYGKLILNNNFSLKGTTGNLEIKSVLGIASGTDITYAIPTKNIGIISNEGIVDFVNTNVQDTSGISEIQQFFSDSVLAILSGIQMGGQLRIDKNARFRVDINRRSGDYIALQGEGILNLGYDRSANTTISGTYTITDGIYQVSYYDLVKKTFEIMNGSRVVWTGDPYRPEFNIHAMHEVRTSSSGLISNELQQVSADQRRQYRKPLPYQVSIFIKGNPKVPQLEFMLDLPEEDRSNFPLVDAKLNRLNEPGNSSALTQQIFGLLTIGGFIPETIADESGGYGQALATTTATNSLNAILSNELNKLSSRILNEGELEFGLQSYSELDDPGRDLTTSMDIRYSKSVMNDRLTIEAESSINVSGNNNASQEYNNNTYDMALTYDLTEQNDYKLKVYNKSSYDIYFKDTRTSGVALLFVKDYDDFEKDLRANSKKNRRRSNNKSADDDKNSSNSNEN